MIQINNTIGTKSLFLNVFKSVKSVSVSTTQYTHESLHTRLLSDRYKLFVTNQLTSSVSSVYLTFVSSNSRGAYFTFEFNTQGSDKLQLTELGTYTYEVYNMSAKASPSDQINVLDSGLFRIINNVTFEDKYFNADEQVIPTNIVYKP
tara:strand:+ start:20836 stop:21279 length:444 start_codon:yes stop_codon:yes gene_type:complete